ncbi:MAG TPA: acyl carrier protein [Thermoanaerobaculia bacterium]|nr:acyl carrier protein [Thermoanaerobaculia bacterium]
MSPLTPRVRDLLSRLGVPGVAALDGAASLSEAGLVDSFRMLELLIALEAEFAITIENREVLPENLDSIDGIAAFMARKHDRG